jgi:penicillin amidase
MRRALTTTLAIVAALAVTAGVAAYWYLRSSLPIVDGEVSVLGTSGPVDIIRDADHIPHIFAGTKADALFGLGYVHAQDRLWQMEFQRRIGFGRLSEVFGSATIAQDRFLRTVGFGRAARSAWDHLPDDARDQINAYIAGVNAFIATHHGRQLPPEFTVLRFEPEPFSGPDVLVWVKMMAWDLSANYSVELTRHDILKKVGADRLNELMPPYPPAGLSILDPPIAPRESRADRATIPQHETRQASLDAGVTSDPSLSALFARGLMSGIPSIRGLLHGGGTTEALGSNNWVVDGTMTASGRPLLANDPHLGAHVPSLWYLAHMSAGDWDVIGATLPGAPAVAIGRNRFIAWGETNVAADVEDLYIERLNPAGTTAEYRGVPEPIKIVSEILNVKGAAPVRLDVRITRHGPLISDAINVNNAQSKTATSAAIREPLALRWTALDDEDTTVIAFLKLNEARNWGEFTSALRHFVTPAQNFVYGDVEGHIGYYAPGRIPRRSSGDGSRPAPGWTGEAEWIGWVAFNDLPHLFDPPSHFIVTANNRPMSGPGAPFIALEYPEPYRAQRITHLIQEKAKFTADDFETIQADMFSPHAQTLLPLLLRSVRPETDVDRRAVDMLRRWKYDAGADSAAEAIFQAWFLRLASSLAGDDLGPTVLSAYEGRFSYITRFVTNVLTANNHAWCDDTRTPAQEACETIVTRALHDGVAELTRRMGSGLDRWRWDAVHHAIFPHQGFDSVSFLRPFLSRSLPNGGDWSTVNVGPVVADEPFEQHSVPGYRQVVDLSPANDSRFLDAVGQSGHFLSKQYDDFLADWRQVRSRRMRLERSDVEKGATGRIRLRPED